MTNRNVSGLLLDSVIINASYAFWFQGGCGGLASFLFGGKLMVARFRAAGARVKGLVAIHSPVLVRTFSWTKLAFTFGSGFVTAVVWIIWLLSE